ncbi:MAG: pyridoxal-phosphate dependent enzyme [Chloroflexi bacterium]|nr:pyridoxal-phosphate dependent enzyme [Chloroflexota bacterium]
MPEHAPPAKIEATRSYGAEIRFGADTTKLMPIVQQLRDERGLRFVPPFDDDDVIAGQGTVGLEIMEDLRDADLVVVPVGGGGLISGVALAVAELRPGARVVGVEPEGAQAVRLGLAAGKPVKLDSVRTVADGLAAPFAGERNLEIIRRLVSDVVVVSDEEIVEALRFIAARARLVVEPAAAAGVAALLMGRVTVVPGQRVVAILTGANIDLTRAGELLAPA